eukprot:7716907-Alexandrium_andersonii.AAC.1
MSHSIRGRRAATERRRSVADLHQEQPAPRRSLAAAGPHLARRQLRRPRGRGRTRLRTALGSAAT